MKLSIVTTLYKSSLYVDEFYKRASAEAKKITDDYEIIFVDDGSPDDSLQKAVRLHLEDSKVVVVELSRNFGHHKAIMTGLSYATGDYIFLIDSDLEEEPELLSRFWVELQNSDDTDVVYGVQESRRGNWLQKITGKIFYKIYNSLFTAKMSTDIMTSRLMTKRYLKSLLTFKEHELTLAGVLSAAGYVQKPIFVKKHSSSVTTYTFGKKISAFVTAITCFSNKPLIYVFNLGVVVSLLSFSAVAYLSIRKIIFGIDLTGWTSIVVSIWLVGGLIIFCIGILGIYLSKIFIEVKDRPYTLVKKEYKKESQVGSHNV